MNNTIHTIKKLTIIQITASLHLAVPSCNVYLTDNVNVEMC